MSGGLALWSATNNPLLFKEIPMSNRLCWAAMSARERDALVAEKVDV